MVGLTLKVYGLALMPPTVTGVVPSVYVTLHGWLPVSAILIAVLAPLQMVADPLITLVGLGLTVTIALPVISPAWAVQLTSVNAVTV